MRCRQCGGEVISHESPDGTVSYYHTVWAGDRHPVDLPPLCHVCSEELEDFHGVLVHKTECKNPMPRCYHCHTRIYKTSRDSWCHIGVTNSRWCFIQGINAPNYATPGKSLDSVYIKAEINSEYLRVLAYVEFGLTHPDMMQKVLAGSDQLVSEEIIKELYSVPQVAKPLVVRRIRQKLTLDK